MSNTAMAGTFALQPTDGSRLPSKPWDGYKTGTGPSKKPFDFRGANTDYGQAIGHAAKERELAKDIQNLDWELKTLGTVKTSVAQSEANLKPNLFMKKKGFNDTGETKATVGQNADEWDLPDTKPTKPVYQPMKEKSAEASEWNLGKIDSLVAKPKGGKPAANRQ